MAVWQWSIYLVPEERVHEFAANSECRLSSEKFESIAWWADQTPDRYINFFDNKFARDDRPYARNQVSWGSVDKNDVSIGCVGQKLRYIAIRIDARDPENLLAVTVELCKAFDLWIYDYNAEVFIPPESADTNEAFKNSRAIQFSTNPRAFFDDTEYLNDVNKKNKAKLESK